MSPLRIAARQLCAAAIAFTLAGLLACGGVTSSNNNGNPAPNPTPPSSPSPSPGPSPTPSPAPSSTPAKFVYALDASMIGNPSIAGFSFNNSNGALTQLAGSPFSIAAHKDVYAMAATSATQFLFTADWLDKTIETYRADSNTGALTLTKTLSTPELMLPINMLVDPAGKFLFVADENASQIAVYSIASDGTLTAVPGSPFKTDGPALQLTITAAGDRLYVGEDNTVFGFSIASNGALTPLPGVPVTPRPPVFNPDKGPTNLGVAVDPAGKFLFVGDTTAQQTWVYSIASDGSLTLVTGSPFTTPGGVGIMTVSPDGRFLFDGGGAVVAAFTIQSSGALVAVPGSPFPNGPFNNGGAPVSQLETDPQGKFLLLSDVENSEITVFSIDQNTGALTNVQGSPFPVAPSPIGGGSPSHIAITE